MSAVAVAVVLGGMVVAAVLAIVCFVDPDDGGPLGRAARMLTTTVPRGVGRLLSAVGLMGVVRAVGGAGWWFMYKPHPIIQVAYILLVVGCYTAFAWFGYPLLPNRYLAGYHRWLGALVFAGCLVTFYGASFTDPGTITRSNVASYQAAFPVDGFLYAPDRQCDTCHIPKVARSKHCRVCDRCVPPRPAALGGWGGGMGLFAVSPPASRHDWSRRTPAHAPPPPPPMCPRCVSKFDHHCIWLNNCVGQRNYRWFLAYLVLNSVLMIYGAIGAASIFATEIQDKRLFEATFINTVTQQRTQAGWVIIFQYLMGQFSELMMVTFMATVMGVLVTGFTCYHLFLAARNVTTNETYKWSEAHWHRDRAVDAWRAAKRQHAAGRSDVKMPPEPVPMPASAYDRGVLPNLWQALTAGPAIPPTVPSPSAPAAAVVTPAAPVVPASSPVPAVAAGGRRGGGEGARQRGR
jgi:palmitoyltransferase ZDHHC4